MVEAADEVAAGAVAHDMEVGDMITMAMVMGGTGGETMVGTLSACINSIDCCCSGVYHL